MENTICDPREFFTEQLVKQCFNANISLIVKKSNTFIKIFRNVKANIVIEDLGIFFEPFKIQSTRFNIYDISTRPITTCLEDSAKLTLYIIKFETIESVNLLTILNHVKFFAFTLNKILQDLVHIKLTNMTKGRI